MTLYKQNFSIIISYLFILLIPSAVVRFGHLSASFFLITTIVDCLGAAWLLYLNQRTQANAIEQQPFPLKPIIIWGLYWS